MGSDLEVCGGCGVAGPILSQQYYFSLPVTHLGEFQPEYWLRKAKLLLAELQKNKACICEWLPQKSKYLTIAKPNLLLELNIFNGFWMTLH